MLRLNSDARHLFHPLAPFESAALEIEMEGQVKAFPNRPKEVMYCIAFLPAR